MVGLDSGDATFSTVGNTGGSKDAITVSHTHTISDSGHTHPFSASSSTSPATGGGPGAFATGPVSLTTSSAFTGISVNTAGSSGTNANLMPYVVVYCWKRTA